MIVKQSITNSFNFSSTSFLILTYFTGNAFDIATILLAACMSIVLLYFGKKIYLIERTISETVFIIFLFAIGFLFYFFINHEKDFSIYLVPLRKGFSVFLMVNLINKLVLYVIYKIGDFSILLNEPYHLIEESKLLKISLLAHALLIILSAVAYFALT